MRYPKLSVLLLALVLLLAACGGDEQNGAAEDEAEIQTLEPLEVVVEVDNELAFDPNRFEIEDGQEMVVTMRNTGALEHNWVWNDQEDEVWLYTQGGEEDTAARVFDTPGVYGFYCSIPGHREAGMIGEVTVAE